jgi:hypothetical protein
LYTNRTNTVAITIQAEAAQRLKKYAITPAQQQDAMFRSLDPTADTHWGDSSDDEFLKLHLKDGPTMKRIDLQN